MVFVFLKINLFFAAALHGSGFGNWNCVFSGDLTTSIWNYTFLVLVLTDIFSYDLILCRGTIISSCKEVLAPWRFVIFNCSFSSSVCGWWSSRPPRPPGWSNVAGAYCTPDSSAGTAGLFCSSSSMISIFYLELVKTLACGLFYSFSSFENDEFSFIF